MAESWPTSMVVPPFVMMIREPTNSTKIRLKYTQNCISGALSATTRSAKVKSLAISCEAAANFCFSYPSRAKPLTTRIARTFSSTDSLSLSYLRNTARNAGIALRAIRRSPITSTGTIMRNVVASAPPMI